MSGHLLVSISSIFAETRPGVQKLVRTLDAEGIPVSLLVAPRIDSDWRLSKDPETLEWLLGQKEEGRAIILNGFDQAVQGRRAEFANLGEHEARLRLQGATRQMTRVGFDPDVFAPPRWRLSPGTLAVLPEFGFTVACSTRGVHKLVDGSFLQARNLSVGEGFGSAKWWRTSLIKAADRGASKGNTVRLSISGRNIVDGKTVRDFLRAATMARERGSTPSDYRLFVST